MKKDYFKNLAVQRNFGKPIDLMRVNNHQWIGNLLENPIQVDERGWPIQPFLEITVENEGEILRKNFTVKWVNPDGSLVQKTEINIRENLVWPGAISARTAELLGNWNNHQPQLPEQIRCWRILQQMAQEQIGEDFLKITEHLQVGAKKEALEVLTTDLPADFEKRKESIKRRNQFIEANPGLVSWIAQSEPDQKNLLWAMEAHNTDHNTSALKIMCKQVDDGEKVQKIWDSFQKDQEAKIDLKDVKVLAGLLKNITITSKKRMVKFLENNQIAKQEALRDNTPEGSKEIEKIYHNFVSVIARLQKEYPKTKLSRVKSESLQYPRANQWQKEKNLVKRHIQLNSLLIQWQAQDTFKIIGKRLQREQERLPPEQRHPVVVPEITHIRDYFNAKYPEEIPTGEFSPRKLIEAIRKWDDEIGREAEDALLQKDISIPEEILNLFPSRIKTQEFEGNTLKSKHEFELESKKQKHCVRGYFDAAKHAEYAIYSFQTKEGKFTAQISPEGKIIQLRGYKNKSCSSQLNAELQNASKKEFKIQKDKEPEFYPDFNKTERTRLKKAVENLREGIIRLITPTEQDNAPKALKKLAKEKGFPIVSYSEGYNTEIEYLALDISTPITNSIEVYGIQNKKLRGPKEIELIQPKKTGIITIKDYEGIEAILSKKPKGQWKFIVSLKNEGDAQTKRIEIFGTPQEIIRGIDKLEIGKESFENDQKIKEDLKSNLIINSGWADKANKPKEGNYEKIRHYYFEISEKALLQIIKCRREAELKKGYCVKINALETKIEKNDLTKKGDLKLISKRTVKDNPDLERIEELTKKALNNGKILIRINVNEQNEKKTPLFQFCAEELQKVKVECKTNVAFRIGNKAKQAQENANPTVQFEIGIPVQEEDYPQNSLGEKNKNAKGKIAWIKSEDWIKKHPIFVSREKPQEKEELTYYF